jgi:hypothetical protein
MIGNGIQSISPEFMEAVGMGLVPGWSFVEKFGENPLINTADGFDDIWDAGSEYIPPTEPRIHNVASTLANDSGTVVSSGTATSGAMVSLVDSSATFVSDGVAIGDNILNDSVCEIGEISSVDSETQVSFIARMRNPDTGIPDGGFIAGQSYRIVATASDGASLVYVKGLNSEYVMQNEFVVTNGLSNVPTVGLYPRQFRMRAFGAGTTGAKGIITSTAETDGTVSCQIIDGNNQTLMAIYTFPSDKVGYIVRFWASLSRKTGAVSTVRLRAGVLDAVSYVQQTRSIGATGKSDFNDVFPTTLPIVGGADLWMEADTDTNGIGVSGGFTVLLKDVSVDEINPSFITCLADKWTKVATSAIGGQVFVQDGGVEYMWTYRDAGATAPDDAVTKGGIRLTSSDEGEPILSSSPIDVYIRAIGGDGEVQVML